ncbi:hypothetical protein SNE40_015030 [Patella caerulea]|uniref:Uncharacterized protein n=1 Tax=Patella caerulea TaxID=87958 RepID=A0AAN8JMD5_PATCE
MKILYLVCLLPLLTVWTCAHGDKSDVDKETSGVDRWDRRDDMSEQHGYHKTGYVRVVGMVTESNKGRHHNDKDDMSMSYREEDNERGRQSERKDWDDRRRGDDKTWEGNDDDGDRRHGSNMREGGYEGHQRRQTKDDESRRGAGRRHSMDVDDEQCAHGRHSRENEYRHSRRRKPMDDGKSGRPNRRYPMGGEDRRRPHGDIQWVTRRIEVHIEDRLGTMKIAEDLTTTILWTMKITGDHTVGKSEEELRRAYIKFFGKIDMMKDSKGSGSWEENPYELAGVVTISFLKMCECDGDDATKLLQKFIAKAEKTHEDDSDVKKMPEIPEVPNFKGNETAKVEFYRRLSMEQKELLFGYDLIQNMCRGAKVFLTESKIFFDKYFPRNNSGIPLDARVIKPKI